MGYRWLRTDISPTCDASIVEIDAPTGFEVKKHTLVANQRTGRIWQTRARFTRYRVNIFIDYVSTVSKYVLSIQCTVVKVWVKFKVIQVSCESHMYRFGRSVLIFLIIFLIIFKIIFNALKFMKSCTKSLIFSLTIAGISLLSCLYVLGH